MFLKHHFRVMNHQWIQHPEMEDHARALPTMHNIRCLMSMRHHKIPTEIHRLLKSKAAGSAKSLTSRHLPLTSGDSKGFGVGFILSSCCTMVSTASWSSAVAVRPRFSWSIRSSNCTASQWKRSVRGRVIRGLWVSHCTQK